MLRHTVAGALRRAEHVADSAWSLAASTIGHLEPTSRPIAVERGAPPIGARAAVFCHFDRKGRLADHTRRYLEALLDAEFAVIFVSNSATLEAEARDWLLRRCAWVVLRRNSGLDFAAWRDGLAVSGLPDAGTQLLVLANDSVYGPVSPLAPLLERMRPEHAEVWGMTDSWQQRYHLQSFFLLFTPAALRSSAFEKFWTRVRDLRSKTAIIRQYEVGLTQRMLDAGLRCRALWPYVDLIAGLQVSDVDDRRHPGIILRDHVDSCNMELVARRTPLNPTAELWRPLFLAGFPFLKRELLRTNPIGVQDVGSWLDLVRSVSPLDAEIILRDLARTLRNVAP